MNGGGVYNSDGGAGRSRGSAATCRPRGEPSLGPRTAPAAARSRQLGSSFRSQLTDLPIDPLAVFLLSSTADMPKTGRNAGEYILNSGDILYVESTLVLYLNHLTDKFKQYIHESKAEFERELVITSR